MQATSTVRAALVAAALAVPAVPALAQPHVVEVVTPARTEVYHAPPSTYYYSPGTTYYYTPPSTTTYYYTTTDYSAPPITVEAPYLTEDQRITSDVVGAIAANPRVSGRIGVETRDNEVTLSGYTPTPGQARHAERDARRVDGVRHVNNEIRPRVGGMP
jgi:hypothetical protein